MRKWAFMMAFVILFSVLAACAGRQTANLSVGMTKAEVISLLGTPIGFGGDGNKEYLNYSYHENLFGREPVPYTVVLQDGKVVSYGRQGQTQ